MVASRPPLRYPVPWPGKSGNVFGPHFFSIYKKVVCIKCQFWFNHHSWVVCVVLSTLHSVHYFNHQHICKVETVISTAGDPDSIPGSGRSLGEENGNPLQYSCLENPMDRGASQPTVHGMAKSRTWLSDQHIPRFENWGPAGRNDLSQGQTETQVTQGHTEMILWTLSSWPWTLGLWFWNHSILCYSSTKVMGWGKHHPGCSRLVCWDVQRKYQNLYFCLLFIYS